jgi:hypothetical protein
LVTRKELLKLKADEFESLVCDLLILHGLQNATWRTPGADGGRDIEGRVDVLDLSGNVETQKWYIECKRYSKSVDWPTVYHKIAHADNHRADYLLICTTASLSPACKSEIKTWNNGSRIPKIRYWDFSDLIRKIDKEPIIKTKYGFNSNDTNISLSMLPISRLVSKIIQLQYGLVSQDTSPSLLNIAIEFSASLTELISSTIERLSIGNSAFYKPFNVDRDLYCWCLVENEVDLTMFDAYGIRALLTLLRYFTRSAEITLHPRKLATMSTGQKKTQKSDGISIILPPESISSPAIEAMKLIAIWTNFQIIITDNTVEIVPNK